MAVDADSDTVFSSTIALKWNHHSPGMCDVPYLGLDGRRWRPGFLVCDVFRWTSMSLQLLQLFNLTFQMAGFTSMKALLGKSTLCKSTVLWRCFLLHGKNPEIIHSNLLAFLFLRLNQTVGDPKVSAAPSLLHPFFCDPAADSTAAWPCLQLFNIWSAAEADRCLQVGFLLMHSDNQTSSSLRRTSTLLR